MRQPKLDLEQIRDIEMWRQLCPQMTLTEERTPHQLPAYPIDETRLQSEYKRIKEDGYLIFESLIPTAEVQQMADTIEIVSQSHQHPIFSLVYDAFWSTIYRLSPLLRLLLGDDYKLQPNAWIWNLPPDDQQKGWIPHRDRPHGTLLPNGSPQAITLWLPLTDATPLNGCIYALPASRDKRYHRYGDPNEETGLALQDIRALPAPAGSVLSWTPQLLHWGARSSSWATHPRISFSFELQSPSIKALDQPLLDPSILPDFQMRLGLIAKQLLQYKHMNPLSPELERISKQLEQTLPQKRSFSSVLKKWLNPPK